MLERPAEPRLKSPLARAVVPVVAGIGFFAVLFGVLWIVAAVTSGNGTPLGRTVFEVGRVDVNADRIAKNGPLLYPDLADSGGRRAVIVDHTGTVDTKGWVLYAPFPADREGSSCPVQQVAGTRTYTDCDGRTLDVEDLQPATFAEYVIEEQRTLIVRLKPKQPIPPASTVEA